MDPRDKIVQIIREKGPVIPLQIAKELGVNTIFAGAMLSELTDKKVLKITKTKIGGSPLYYLPGQEKMLEMLYDKLPEKLQKTYLKLKEKLILQDSEEQPVIRAALKELKDFAIPLEVQVNGVNHIFWKWYLITDEEAAEIIKQKLGIKEDKKLPKEAKQEIIEAEQKYGNEVKQRERPRKDLDKYETKKKEIQRRIIEIEDRSGEDELFKKSFAFFKKNEIQVLDYKIIRKNMEIDFIVLLPSPVGSLKYFCKVLGKKKISEGDIATVYLAGQKKRLPTLLLCTGEVAKKALQKLTTEYGGMTLKQF